MIDVLFVCTGNACRFQLAEAMNVSLDCSDENHKRGADLISRLEAVTDEGVDR